MVALSDLLPGFPGDDAELVPLLLGGLASGVNPIDALADLADVLPEPLRVPDATPSVATGASEVSRADAFTYAALASAPRFIDALGPAVSGVVVGGETFALVETYDDPVSGFEAVQLRSLADGRAVFAVDGTDFDSLPDVVADLNLARPQVASPAFAAMVADAGAAALAEDLEVVFAGASLGGALVQVAGYETAEAIRAASSGASERVTVLGIDALGGRDAAEDINGGALDPAVLERMNALNIRTATDVVSRSGSHLGDSLSFQAVDAAGNPVEISGGEAHVNFESLSTTLSSDELFAAGVRGDPGEIGGFSFLADTLGPRLSALLSDPALAGLFGRPAPEGPPAGGVLDPAGRFFDVDANGDGAADLRVLLGGAGDTLIA